MVKLVSLNETKGRKVYTELGDYFGEVEEGFVQNNKIYGWKIRSTSNSLLSRLMNAAKGVIIPHALVNAVGDIMIISKSAIPAYTEKDNSEKKQANQDVE
jgi:sporulation protein YlmC with PRC-barrel domain